MRAGEASVSTQAPPAVPEAPSTSLASTSPEPKPEGNERPAAATPEQVDEELAYKYQRGRSSEGMNKTCIQLLS